MEPDYFKKLNSDPEIIKNYDFLKNLGIFDNLQLLNEEIMSLEELLKKVLELFNIQSVIELVDYVINLIINKFVPSYLTFILQDEIDPDKPNIISYKNMIPFDIKIKIDSLEPYKKFFLLSPAIITFNAFENMFENKKLTDIFIPLNPDIIVPMLGLDGLYGFIVIGEKITEKKYTEKEIRYVDRLMKFVSASLQNTINYKRSITDSKTGLYNVNYFYRRLNEELSRIQRYNMELSLLMIDIDFFKNINDKFGHLIGDKILRNISNELKKNLRLSDILARFGGEEFVIMLSQTNRENAFTFAERIRKAIENLKVNLPSQEISKITISIGISYCSKDQFYDMDTLIKQVDIALYQSKNTGRNKTTVFISQNND